VRIGVGCLGLVSAIIAIAPRRLQLTIAPQQLVASSSQNIPPN